MGAEQKKQLAFWETFYEDNMRKHWFLERKRIKFLALPKQNAKKSVCYKLLSDPTSSAKELQAYGQRLKKDINKVIVDSSLPQDETIEKYVTLMRELENYAGQIDLSDIPVP